MLVDVSQDIYRKIFTEDPHPYITDEFINLVEPKTDRIIRLIESDEKASIGLIAGLKNNILSSPFSSPFGGFHFLNDEVIFSDIFNYVVHLKEFALEQKIQKIEIILPPDIYHSSINAKFVNAFVQNGFAMAIPDIVCSINLNKFSSEHIRKRIKENYKLAVKKNLTFSHVTDEKLMEEAYNLIVINRKALGREIYMCFSDLLDVNNIIPVDFFLVKDEKGESVGSAIFYRGHKSIVQAIFWGDIIPRRPLGIMDFLVVNLYNYYKNMGFEYIDLALSSKDGIPNEGLLRFKETHNCNAALRFTFTWAPPQ